MTTCPICQTTYQESPPTTCHTCGWDLAPYALTFCDTIPDDYVSKAKKTLEWAQSIWNQLQRLPSQEEITELQREKERLLKLVHQIETQIEEEIDRRRHLTEQISLLEKRKSQLDDQNKNLVEESAVLANQLAASEDCINRVIQEREEILEQMADLEQKHNYTQTALEQLEDANKNLENENKNLVEEKDQIEEAVSELRLSNEQQISQMREELTNANAELNTLYQQSAEPRRKHRNSINKQPQQELRLITSSGTVSTHYLSLQGRYASHPGDYFHSNKNREQLRERLEHKANCKLSDVSLDKIIREWVEDIRLGNTPTTVKID